MPRFIVRAALAVGERDSAGHKREFERSFGMPAHDSRVYVRHFARDVLDAARPRVAAVDALLRVLGQ